MRNFFVLVENGEMIACCALAPVWEDLAEVCSLVVREDMRGRGLGRVAVEACVAECAELGIRRVFALTYQEKFFNHIGFATAEHFISLFKERLGIAPSDYRLRYRK